MNIEYRDDVKETAHTQTHKQTHSQVQNCDDFLQIVSEKLVYVSYVGIHDYFGNVVFAFAVVVTVIIDILENC